MMSPQESIKNIYRAAIAAVEPRRCVRSAMNYNAAARCLTIQRVEIELGNKGVYLVAIGKAGALMARGAIDVLGDAVAGGVVVTKERVSGADERLNFYVGTHPVPDERSLRAGAAVLEFVASIPPESVVVCLISGGGSALVEAVNPSSNLGALQDITNQLLRSGATIQELNAVRSRLSLIKGGQLLGLLAGHQVVNLVVSDVIGDDLQAIASGPTVLPSSNFSAEEVLNLYAANIDLPAPNPAPVEPPVTTCVVANLPLAINAAAHEAHNLGLNPTILSDQLEGEAREVGATLAEIMRRGAGHLSPISSGSCVLAGGETTVNVTGDGVGGRNTEAALAAAIHLSGTTHATVGFLATDGDDGVTGSAGGIVDGATISAENRGKARLALDENDSYRYLSEAGAVWSPGPTGTNVNDLVIGIVE